ncbi:MAG: MBL fold metallo-hydrolase [Planctomycetota bacterium]|nr:MBL fold metallo-hydrolase [Planctomycetota bacterium]
MPSNRLHLAVVVSELFQENAYIAHLEGRLDCLVFDPGLDSGAMIDQLAEMKLTPAAILNTHGHADHIAGNGAMKEKWPAAPLVIGTNDASKLTDPIENLSRSYGVDLISPAADKLVNEGDVYAGAGLDLEVYDTPGHSIGHVVFVWKAGSPWVVFGGDVLFQGSIGRTDFPDGSFEQLASSIRNKLYTLPDDTLVLPGHGPTTTIGFEKQHNPFVPAL